MYTLEMSTAFKNIKPPKNFGVVIYDNDNFITIEINPEQLLDLTEQESQEAVDYINEIKRTFESFGSIVFIVRNAIDGKEDDD
jgi:hypothetical protein